MRRSGWRLPQRPSPRGSPAAACARVSTATGTAAAAICRRSPPARLRMLRFARLRRQTPPPTASRRSQSFLLSLKDLEDADHMREPKNLQNRGAQPEQHELLVQALRVLEHLDEGRDSGTIDVPDGLQVQSQP